jgi:hypothetical protein
MKIQLTAPSAWHELSGNQVLFVAEMFLKKLPEIEFLTNCLLNFTGLKSADPKISFSEGETLFWFRKGSDKPFAISPEQFQALINELKWLVKDIGLCRPPEKLGNYFPVNGQLYGVSLEEYLLADNLYMEYSRDKKQDSLNKLIAVFYRKKDEAWDEQRYKIRIGSARQLPRHAKHAVYIWFTGVKAWIIKKYPEVFKKPSAGEEAVPADETILRLLSSLNSGDVTLNKDILKTHIHEVFYELNRKIEQSNKT